MPPYFRVVDESACENDWNRRESPAALKPDAGVAHGEAQLTTSSSIRLVTLTTTSPFSGELHRMETG